MPESGSGFILVRLPNQDMKQGAWAADRDNSVEEDVVKAIIRYYTVCVYFTKNFIDAYNL